VGQQLLAEPGGRLATLVVQTPDQAWSTESSFTIEGRAGTDPPITATVTKRYVYEPDDSVERTGLLAVLCEAVGAPMLHAKVGLLTSDTRIQSPWLTAFEVMESMPWREDQVKAALDALGAGIVEVKTRGKVVNPDVVQMALRGSGDQTLTVFILRFDKAVRAIITRRL
jgi:hypothetical protein